MERIIRVILLSFSTLWLSLVWLWFIDIPILPYLFSDSNGELGLLFVLYLFFVNASVTIIGSIYTFRKKYWWWFGAYVVFGGGPIAAYFTLAFIDAYL